MYDFIPPSRKLYGHYRLECKKANIFFCEGGGELFVSVMTDYMIKINYDLNDSKSVMIMFLILKELFVIIIVLITQ